MRSTCLAIGAGSDTVLRTCFVVDILSVYSRCIEVQTHSSQMCAMSGHPAPPNRRGVPRQAGFAVGFATTERCPPLARLTEGSGVCHDCSRNTAFVDCPIYLFRPARPQVCGLPLAPRRNDRRRDIYIGLV